MNAAAYLHSWSGAPGARDHGASAALSRWVIAQDVDVQKVFGWLSEQTDQHAAAETIGTKRQRSKEGKPGAIEKPGQSIAADRETGAKTCTFYFRISMAGGSV